MSQPASNNGSQAGGFIVGMTMGAIVGLVLGGLVAGALTFVFVGRLSARRHPPHHKRYPEMEINRRTVLVAARNLPAGMVISADMLHKRRVPVQLVTRSMVQPFAARRIVGHKLLAPVHRGDMMLWSFFLAPLGPRTCAQVCPAKRPHRPPPPKLATVLAASDDIPAGTALSYDLFSQRAVPAQCVTSSNIKPAAADALIGQRALVSIREGDVLLWPELLMSSGRHSCRQLRRWSARNRRLLRKRLHAHAARSAGP